MKSGIYKITNLKNYKVYIGQSENLTKRIKYHMHLLKLAKENNKEINEDAKKYGVDNFNFEIIEYCDVKDLDEKEKYYIQKYNAIENGYNVRKGGYLGRKYKKETNKIIRTIYIDDETWELAEKIANKDKRSISSLIAKLIIEKGGK